MAEKWRVEYHVLDAQGAAVDWLDDGSRSAAIEAARKCGGSVEKVTEYLSDREEIFNARDEAEDDE